MVVNRKLLCCPQPLWTHKPWQDRWFQAWKIQEFWIFISYLVSDNSETHSAFFHYKNRK